VLDADGNSLWGIKRSIENFTKVLNLLKNNLDKKIIRKILILKNNENQNFLTNSDSDYLNPEYSTDLIGLFELIFSIFGADLQLFDELFYAKTSKDESFLNELIKCYEIQIKEKELNLVLDWIKLKFGEDFIKKN
jgi:hypothetical protein